MILPTSGSLEQISVKLLSYHTKTFAQNVLYGEAIYLPTFHLSIYPSIILSTYPQKKNLIPLNVHCILSGLYVFFFCLPIYQYPHTSLAFQLSIYLSSTYLSVILSLPRPVFLSPYLSICDSSFSQKYYHNCV